MGEAARLLGVERERILLLVERGEVKKVRRCELGV